MGTVTAAIFISVQVILYFGVIVPYMILAEPHIYGLAYLGIEAALIFCAWRMLRFANHRVPPAIRKYALATVPPIGVFVLWLLLYGGLEREKARWTSDDRRAMVRYFDTLNRDMFFPTAPGSGSQMGHGYVRVYCEGRKIFEHYDALWVMADQPNRSALNDAVRQCTPQTYIESP